MEERGLKRVLCVAFYFPPTQSIASLRMKGIAKYLGGFGWHPVFLTPRSAEREELGFDVVELEYQGGVTQRLARRFLPGRAADPAEGSPEIVLAGGPSRLRGVVGKVVRALAAVPDNERGWLRDAVRAGETVLTSQPFSAIMTSGPPWTAHLIGQRLKQHAGIPWIAEYRDLWTLSHYYPHGSVRRFVDRRLELRAVGKADLLTTVSEPLARDLSQLFPAKPVAVVRNGFDPDDVAAAPLTSAFTITHTGQLYRGKRDPTMLLEAVRQLADTGEIELSRIGIRFYGPTEAWLPNQVHRAGLDEVVEIGGVVSRDRALDLQRESQLLLLLNWNHPKETGVYTGKVFEYLAARRPILAVGGVPGVVTELLEQTRAGQQVFELEKLVHVLRDMYKEHVQLGSVKYYGDDAAIAKYDQRVMCRRLAQELSMLVQEDGRC
jgi:hypothetical protein